MAPISNTTPAMQQASGYFENTQNVAKQGVARVEDTMAVLSQVWRGDAFNAYRSSMTGWFNDCATIINALDEMIRLMQGHATQVTRGESDNIQVAANIPTGAGLGI
ncbi:WXG100 family type VII secretion target [Actinosynnema sp. CA-299493]